VAFLSGVAFGQIDSGQITGRVFDPNGANISGAIVQAKSVFTGLERLATTTDEGFFILTNLPPGVYELSVQAQGFAVRAQRVRVFVGSVVRVDTQMSITPVQVEEEVLEGSGGVDINTQTGQLSDPISRRQLTELPVITRDPYSLITLSGNVTPFRINPLGGAPLVGFNSVIINTEPDQDFAIDGQPPTTNNVQVDGGENIVNYWSTLGQRIPLGGVQEINVITNGFRPEYGRLLGGLINVATRPGTNRWRGEVFEFYRGDALNSNSFESNALGITGSHLVGNNFGFAFGGPIVEDKLFFFNSTEFIRVRSRENRVALVPAAAFLANPLVSDDTEAFFGAFAPVPATTQIRDTFTVGETLAALGITATPLGAFSGLGLGATAFNQVFFDVGTNIGGGLPQDTVLTVGRLDYTRSDRSLIYGRYAFVDRDIFRGALSFSPFPGFNTGVRERDHMAVINWLQTLSGPDCCSGPGASAWLMNLKASYNRVNLTRNLDPFVNPAFTSFDLTPRLAATGFAGANIGGFPLAFPGDSPFDPNVNSLFTGPLNLFQASADFAGVWLGHNVQFGGSYYYFQDNRNIFSFQNGLFTLAANTPLALDNLVNGDATSFSTAINPTVNTVIDPITGIASLAATPVQPDFNRSISSHDFSLYGSFNWRITPNINLLLGARYDFFDRPRSRNDQVFFNFFPGPGTDAGARIANGLLAPTGLVDIDGDGDIDDTFFHRDTNNIAPRIGFAWDITGGSAGCCGGLNRSTTLRASFGITYERLFYATAPFFQTRFNFGIPSLTTTTALPTGTTIGTIPLVQPTATAPTNFGPLVPGATLPGFLARGIERDLDAPRLTFWTVALDREIARNTVVSLQYAGAHGHDLFTLTNINRPGSAAFFLPAPQPASGRVNILLNPIFGTNLSPIFFLRNEGRSNFNAFIADLTNSTWRTNGLSFTARYRWSKALDDVSPFFGNNFGTFGGSFTPNLLSPLNPDFDYGPSDFDVRHRFISSVIWEVPYNWFDTGCCGGSDWRRWLLGGWAVTGIFNFQTGFPFTVFDCGGAVVPETPCPRAAIASGVDLSDIRSGQGSSVPDPVIPNRFNFIGAGNFVPTAPGTNPTVFPPFPTNTVGRNFFRGPGFSNVDLGVYKRFRISEETSFQLRGEFYNVFNHANLFVPFGVDIGSSAGSSDFVPAFKRGRRIIQLGAKFIF
jgi:hypothetical protein